MARKARRQLPAELTTERTHTGRKRSRKEDSTDKAQYAYVRGDLIRIGILALSLFGMLILLRVFAVVLGLVP